MVHCRLFNPKTCQVSSLSRHIEGQVVGPPQDQLADNFAECLAVVVHKEQEGARSPGFRLRKLTVDHVVGDIRLPFRHCSILIDDDSIQRRSEAR